MIMEKLDELIELKEELSAIDIIIRKEPEDEDPQFELVNVLNEGYDITHKGSCLISKTILAALELRKSDIIKMIKEA
jgi:hypothetical protein